MHDTYACVHTLYVHIYICMIHMHAAKPDKISFYNVAQSQHRPNVMVSGRRELYVHTQTHIQVRHKIL